MIVAGEPVHRRYVLPQPELNGHHHDQRSGEQERRVREPDAQRLVDVVGETLTDRGAQHLDDPEVDRDFRDLVQHLAGSRRSRDPPGIGGHAREVGHTSM